ncbi:MAG: hypothetical protein R3C25_03120 [Hyphomonadaceae bacterium]
MTRWTDLPDAKGRAAFAHYFAKIDRALAPLPRAEADEVKNELEAHALDAIAAGSDVHAALAQLGEPDDFLPALVSERLRARAARTFSPGDVAAALARSAASGLSGFAISAFAGIGYAIAAASLGLGLLKLFAPKGTGIFRLTTGELFIGADESVQGVDLLGIWFSPLAIAVGVCLYVVLTWTFGRATVRKRAPIGRSPMED